MPRSEAIVFKAIRNPEGTMMAVFKRGLNPKAVDALSSMAESQEPNWWKDLLSLWSPSGQWNSERPLRLAIRKNYINFYLKGQSAALVRFDVQSQPYVNVHAKYAFEGTKGQSHAKLVGTQVFHPKSGRSSVYTGMVTLREWMARAETWETAEKAQVERIVAENSTVIDLEVGIPTHVGQNTAQRIDLAALEPSENGARVVCWEIKLVADDRLWSPPPVPEVVQQIDGYRRYLSNEEHRAKIATAYRQTCHLLEVFAKMAEPSGGETLRLDPLVQTAAKDTSHVMVDPEPRLVVIGSREEFARRNWPGHEDKLRKMGIQSHTLPSGAYGLVLCS
jgi:hypothetical protein